MTLALFFEATRVEALDIIPDSLRILPAAQLTTRSFAAAHMMLGFAFTVKRAT
jgi:hypothetical protein